ncbi:S-layer protein [Candidatus Woesearchaeota archaeon]|nr:S-layer protein [Candidatus Woesearchaeota archaeon]
MNFRKTIQKIMALGVGAAFVGATVMSAAAADLKDYPAPFVQDGKFNAVLVVGDEAASSDVIGSVDVATTLQYAAKVKKTVNTGGGSSVSLAGDSKKVEESTNLLELGENLTSIRSSITSSDLKALQDGSITNQYGTHTYTQILELPKYAYVRFLRDTQNDAEVHVDNVPADYLLLPRNTTSATTHAYNLKLSFSPALKSDHATSGTNHLKDVKNKKIKILGKEYEILKADHSAYGNLKLTLMAGAVRDVMNEGDSKTFTLGGKDYEVTLDFVGSTEAKFIVNGQVTDSLKESDTFRLTDGTEVGVVDILAQEFAGGKRAVDFTVGASKIVLEDTATFTKGAGGTVTIGSKDSSYVKTDIVSATDTGINDSSSRVTISSIEIYYDPSSVLYVGKGESGSAIAEAVEGEKNVFFLNGFDYKYEGLTFDSPEEVKIKPAGSQDYKLNFKNKAGIQYSAPLFTLVGGNITLGQSTSTTARRTLVLNESQNITKDDYLLVSKNKYSRVLQFKDAAPGSSTTDNSGTVKFKDVGSGDTFEVTYASLTGDLVLDGNTYRVTVHSDSSNSPVRVDMDGSGSTGTNAVGDDSNDGIYTFNEAYITLPQLSGPLGPNLTANPNGGGELIVAGGVGNITLVQITSPQDEDSQRSTSGVVFTVSSDGKLDLSTVNGTFDNVADVATTTLSSGLYQIGDSAVKYEGYTYFLADDGTNLGQYGMKVLYDKKSTTATDQDEVAISVPKTSTRANVFVTSGAVSKTESTSKEGEVVYYETTPVEVGSAKLASEVPNIKTVNAIVVGGPCANTAAAALMGNPADCAAGFEEGKAMLKLYENGNNVALLVAGYSAMDTRRAARVLANYETYKGKLVGKEVVVAGTSFTDISVSAPAPKAAATTEASA